MSGPATRMELPPAATTYAVADPAHAIAIGAKHGIKFLPHRNGRVAAALSGFWGATTSPEPLTGKGIAGMKEFSMSPDPAGYRAARSRQRQHLHVDTSLINCAIRMGATPTGGVRRPLPTKASRRDPATADPKTAMHAAR